MLILPMRLEKLRQGDLNLLMTFAAPWPHRRGRLRMLPRESEPDLLQVQVLSVPRRFAKTLLEKAIILPPEAMCCAACPSTRVDPHKLTAITLSKVAISPAAMGRRGMIPAEWTTTSTPPKVASVCL